MSDQPGQKKITRYVIVVHGIGEQRKNETVIGVVSRLAEARREMFRRESYDVLTLGMACGQTGKEMRQNLCRFEPLTNEFQPWLEFKGIPQDPDMPVDEPFLGEPSFSGENLRFADLAWADVMQEDIGDVGQTPEVWSEGLLGRLKRKNKAAQDMRNQGAQVPAWALHILNILKETITYLRMYTRIRAQALDDMIFTRFLGDVQLYGEYAHCRGLAVRRFHRLMRHIEAAHDKEQLALSESEQSEARYTVIAHSLGSIMSLDALLYAHADRDLRLELNGRSENLPFPAYVTKAEREAARKERRFPEFLDTSWAERVDAFVTLGSPIDKYLILWWLNYEYLLETEWMDPELRRIRQQKRIFHFNYCDEQDPVGHSLDVAATAPAIQAVLELKEDKVYNRSAIPGVAHVSYWKDLDLFKRILHRAVDDPGGDSPHPITWFDPKIYNKVLMYSYEIIPYFILALHFFTFTWAWYSNSWHGTAVATLGFLGTFVIGRRMIDLSAWWRQVLKAKEKTTDTELYRLKKGAALRYRIRIAVRQYTYLALSGVFFGFYVVGWPELIPKSKLALMAALTITVVIAWQRLFRTPDESWEEEPPLPSDSEKPSKEPGRKKVSVNPRTQRSLNEYVSKIYGQVAWRAAAALVLGFAAVFLWAVSTSYEMETWPLSLPWLSQARMRSWVPHIIFNLASLTTLAAIVFTYLRLRLLWLRSVIRPYSQKGAQAGFQLDFVSYVQRTGSPVVADPAQEPLHVGAA